MTFLQKLYNFFVRLFSGFGETANSSTATMLETSKPMETKELDNSITSNISTTENEIISNQEEERVNFAKRTLMTKLYILEQEITVFESDFPKEFTAYMDRIENLRQKYNSSLEEIKKLLTFEIDPELDPKKIIEVNILEGDIKDFIGKEVKFNIISKQLQRLVTKLNILYNVSIFHFKEEEKQKVISQVNHAIESHTRVIHEFKSCESILDDRRLKERIVELASYVDYEIFKISIRNSNQAPNELIRNLVMTNEFSGFEYESAFIAFIKDEISDLGELLPLLGDEECRKVLKRKLNDLLASITYSETQEAIIFDTTFWNSFLNLESNLLEMLRASGVDKEKVKVRLIIRMDIKVDESDVLLLPITNANLSLTSLYSITHDEKILLLIRLLKNMSKDITYKEIYFLILLFDVKTIIVNTPNELLRHMEKYLKKYPYTDRSIEEKKKSVMSLLNKEYVIAFTLDGDEKKIVTTLQSLNFDFKVEGNNVFINSFYFNGLENVLSSLKAKTQESI